jgi:hypothetical protein
MVTGWLGTEGREVPKALVAVTTNVYAWPGVKPSMSQVNAGALTVQNLVESSTLVAVYRMIGAFPICVNTG